MSSTPEPPLAGGAIIEPPELLSRAFKRAPFGDALTRYTLLRALLLRGLGCIYAVAFLILVQQFEPLLGSHGLLPVADFLDWGGRALGSRAQGFLRLPSLFWLANSDFVLNGAALLGLGLSVAVVVGFANAPILLALWAIYLSFVHVGQIFYGYGWESLLCEAGFLAIFLAPPLDPRPLPQKSAVPELGVILFRWLTFRVMFGAGLIKIRGDHCWADLTCLAYHYETQPNPNPLSPYFHHLPLAVHKAGALFNHLVELGAPFSVFGPRPARLIGGSLIIVFQLVLIASGNLSFLNWLTIVIALSCFDDGVLTRWLPQRIRERARNSELAVPSRARRFTIIGLSVVIGLLSINPLLNLLSPRQAMNASFDPLSLVNTYGAFGSVSRERHEVVLQGTNDERPDPSRAWRDYELPCKPGDPMRRPCLVSPYHYRLDWQMWFLQFSEGEPPAWLIHLVAKLLDGDSSILSLFAKNPFSAHPPRFVRAALYRYRFTRDNEPGYWRREYLGDLLRPLSRDDPDLVEYLRLHRFR
jgi:hypothetical protein